MKSGAIGEYMIIIGIFWLWFGSALWLKLYLGAPYGSPGMEDIPVGIANFFLADRTLVAAAALVTSVLPGLAIAGIGFWVRIRGRAPEDER